MSSSEKVRELLDKMLDFASDYPMGEPTESSYCGQILRIVSEQEDLLSRAAKTLCYYAHDDDLEHYVPCPEEDDCTACEIIADYQQARR